MVLVVEDSEGNSSSSSRCPSTSVSKQEAPSEVSVVCSPLSPVAYILSFAVGGGGLRPATFGAG